MTRKETIDLLIQALHEAQDEGADRFSEASGLDRAALCAHCEWVFRITKEHFIENGVTEKDGIVAALQSSIQLGYKVGQLLAKEQAKSGWVRKESR